MRLLQSTQSARVAAVQALNMQYQRMSLNPKPVILDPRQTIPGAFPLPLPEMQQPDSVPGRRRNPSPGSSASSSDKERFRIQPYPQPQPRSPPKELKLFCVYAKDLQTHVRLPLVDNYKPSGNNKCPFCHAHIHTRPGKAWEVIVNDKHTKRTFMIKNRFVIKSHRECGGFACVLCARFREADTVCKDIGALMQHLWMDHKAEELEKDDDVIELDE
jgi:hypothetical protein